MFGLKKKLSFEKTHFIRGGAVIGLLLLLFLLFSFEIRNPSLPKENEVAPYKIKAPYDLEFCDEMEYSRDVESAMARIFPVYKYDAGVTDRQRGRLEDFFDTLRGSDPVDELGIEEQFSSKLKTYRDNDFNLVKDASFRLFERAQEEKITPENLLDTLNKLAEWVEELSFQRISKDIIIHILENAVAPNYSEDVEATNKKRLQAKSNVIPTKRFIRKGETIVDDGQIVTADTRQIFNAYGLDTRRGSNQLAAAGALLLAMILLFTVSTYLARFNPGVQEDDNLVVLLCILLGFAFIMLKFVPIVLVRKDFVVASISHIPFFSSYLIPVAAIPMMISILIDSKFAILINITLSAVGGLWSEAGLQFTFVNLIAGTIAIYYVLQVNQRVDLTRAGLIISFTNVFLIVALTLLTQRLVMDDLLWKILVRDGIWGFFNGFFCSVLVIGGLPYLEQAFSVSSSLMLHELADLNKPLLRMLLLEAPGTYHHSMIVANLAEAGAREVGANPLIAKIGAYYHDIGKMKRSLFFSENQEGRGNPHENLAPSLSAIIIESHVKEGLELAKQHNIPDIITDIIEQHHGTTLIAYFYHRAKQDNMQNVDEAYFRYKGPKPQTKEAAMVMLADSAESATRSIKNPNHTAISNQVKKIVNDKFMDGQFNECDMTLKDMEKITNVFVKNLTTMFHSRIEYPDLSELKKKEFHGDSTS